MIKETELLDAVARLNKDLWGKYPGIYPDVSYRLESDGLCHVIRLMGVTMWESHPNWCVGKLDCIGALEKHVKLHTKTLFKGLRDE